MSSYIVWAKVAKHIDTSQRWCDRSIDGSIDGTRIVQQLKTRVDLGVVTMKEYSTLPRVLELKPHHQMQVSVIPRTTSVRGGKTEFKTRSVGLANPSPIKRYLKWCDFGPQAWAISVWVCTKGTKTQHLLWVGVYVWMKPASSFYCMLKENDGYPVYAFGVESLWRCG